MGLPDNVPDLLRAAFVATDSTDQRGAPALRVQIAGSNFIMQPSGWDAAWRAAKSANGTSPAWITWLGDSFTAGAVSTDYINNGFVGLLKARLIAAGYPWRGDYWGTTASLEFTSGFAGTPPFVFNLASSGNLTWGYGRILNFSGGSTMGTSGSPAITFTTPYACTALDIIHFDFNSGTWQYSVDGAAAVTVTNAGGSGSNFDHKRISINGLANTTHTVTFFNQSGNSVCLLQGVATYAATTGLAFGRVAFGGSNLSDYGYTTSGLWPSDRCLVWQGKTNAAATGFGFPTQPACAVIALGLNDCTNGYSVAGFKHSLHRLIRAVRRGYQDSAGNEASVVILAQSNPDAVSSDVTTALSAVNSPMWDQYLQAMAETATELTCAFVNMHAKWGEHGVALGYQTTVQLHPIDAGLADIASVLAQILI